MSFFCRHKGMKKTAANTNIRGVRDSNVPDWVTNNEFDLSVCKFCDALRFPNEPKGHCCGNGRIKLEKPKIPEEMKVLFEKKQFRQTIRRFNNAFAFTSMGCDNEVIQKNGWTPNVRIQGKIYHRIGAFNAEPGQQPKFSQIYFHDQSEEDELNRRIEASKGHRLGKGSFKNPPIQKGGLPQPCNEEASSNQTLNKDDMLTVQRILHKVNPFVKSYKAVSSLDEDTISDVKLVLRRDKKPKKEHHRRYNEPESNTEIALIALNDATQPADIIIHRIGGGVWRISELNRCYDALHYVILFPYGEDGWNGDLRAGKRRISPTQFYCYRTQIRKNHFNSALRGGKLSQQYFCDMFYRAEKWKLNWVRSNQSQIKAEKYAGLHDAIANDDDLQRMGFRLILPPTIIGSPRWYVEHFQDAMAVVRNYGKVRKF